MEAALLCRVSAQLRASRPVPFAGGTLNPLLRPGLGSQGNSWGDCPGCGVE